MSRRGRALLLGASLAAALSPFVSLAALDAPPDNGDTELAAARTALEAHDYARAETLFRTLAANRPGSAEVYDGLAETLAARGKSQEAGQIWQALGRGSLEGREPALAARYLTRLTELVPNDASAHVLLARALMAASAHGEASRHLDRAVELGETSPATRLLQGLALWESGRTTEAESALRAAARGSSQGAHQLARLLLWQGRFTDALMVLEPLADALHALDFELDLAQALEGAGRADEAVAAYRRLIEQAPEHSLPHYRLSILLRRRGLTAEALVERGDYERLLHEEERRKREEGRAQAELDRCWSLITEAVREDAVACFQSLPPAPEALAGLARAHAQAGQHAEAIAVLEQLIVRQPDRQDLRLLLAEEREALRP